MKHLTEDQEHRRARRIADVVRFCRHNRGESLRRALAKAGWTR